VICTELATAKERKALSVCAPEIPVTVTVETVVAARLLAVKVSTLVPVVEFGLNEAVTPLGRPDKERLTLPVNPARSFTVMVVVPVPPVLMLRLLGEAESVKPETGGPTRALMRFCPLGLPHPVTRS